MRYNKHLIYHFISIISLLFPCELALARSKRNRVRGRNRSSSNIQASHDNVKILEVPYAQVFVGTSRLSKFNDEQVSGFQKLMESIASREVPSTVSTIVNVIKQKRIIKRRKRPRRNAPRPRRRQRIPRKPNNSNNKRNLLEHSHRRHNHHNQHESTKGKNKKIINYSTKESSKTLINFRLGANKLENSKDDQKTIVTMRHLVECGEGKRSLTLNYNLTWSATSSNEDLEQFRRNFEDYLNTEAGTNEVRNGLQEMELCVNSVKGNFYFNLLLDLVALLL